LAVLALVSGVLSGAQGCRQPQVAAGPKEPKTKRPIPAALTTAWSSPTYRFNDSAGPGDSVDPDGSQRLLRAGDRLLVSPSGEVAVSLMRTRSDLAGGVPIPARFGGGFVFWTSDVLYRSRTYLGPLEAVAPVPTNALGVEFGFDSVLISSEAGYHRMYRLDRPARIALSPRNVLHTAASDDGRVIALDAAGRALASIDRGETYRDVSAELSDIVELHGEASAAWFELAGGSGAFLLRDGTLARHPLPKPLQQTPLAPERARNADLMATAISDGVLLSDAQAAVARGAELWIVDLEREAPVGRARSLAPAGSECEALSSTDGVLAACFHPKDGVAIVSRAASAAPLTEKHFQVVEPQVAFAKGVLLVAAGCNGKPKEGAACVRDERGAWTEHDLSAQLTALGPSEQRFQLFIPKQGGGAAALVAHETRPGEADRWTLLGVRSEATPLDQKLPPILRRLYQTSYSANGFQHTYRKRVDTSWVVLKNGTLRGFSRAHSLAITPEGRVQIDPRTFEGLARRAGYAVGRDRERRLYHTTNFGETWLQVAAPPYDDPSVHGWNADCSEVGCYLGNWLRRGWANEAPKAAPAFESAVALPPEPAPARPGLECTRLAEKQRIGPSPAPRDSTLQFQETSAGSGSWDRLLGPLRLVAEPKTRHFSWLEPFEVSAVWKTSRARFKPKFEFPERGSVRPILSSTPGHAAGILLQDRRETVPFLVTASGKNWPLANWRNHEPVSAYLDSKEKLWLLSSNCEGAVLVQNEEGVTAIKLSRAYPRHQQNRERGVAKMLLPPCSGFENPEAIAVSPQGQLAVLRLPSGTTPATVDDPALLLTSSSEPIALAPWSTLELASSPACSSSSDGYRALIQPPASWLASAPNTRQPSMSAIVRWSSTRVCLEAVEAPSASPPDPATDPRTNEAWLVARFVGKAPGAALITQKGEERYRQPVACEVTSSSSSP
jgi:hypothetical protein